MKNFIIRQIKLWGSSSIGLIALGFLFLRISIFNARKIQGTRAFAEPPLIQFLWLYGLVMIVLISVIFVFESISHKKIIKLLNRHKAFYFLTSVMIAILLIIFIYCGRKAPEYNFTIKNSSGTNISELKISFSHRSFIVRPLINGECWQCNGILAEDKNIILIELDKKDKLSGTLPSAKRFHGNVFIEIKKQESVYFLAISTIQYSNIKNIEHKKK